jgi:hypothetical protein
MTCGTTPAHGAGHRLPPGGTVIVREGGYALCIDCGKPLGHVPAEVRDAWRVVELVRRMGGYAG